jgi:CheY-like chemotaxis protein
MDGLTAVREIRDAERAGTLSPQMVIALTGNARQGQIDQAMESGMDDGMSHVQLFSSSLTFSRHQAVCLVTAPQED